MNIQIDEEYMESKILEYQDALNQSDYNKSNDLFNKICEIYKPEKFITTWQKNYQYLYDTPEDFEQEYMKVFILTLKKWKPRNQRKASKYNGAGTFKNYFWGSLNHNFINVVKSIEGSAKRNISLQCPECNEWHSPISSHIIKAHKDVLWKKLEERNILIHEITECPFCSSNIYRGKNQLSENELIKKHILSKHLYMLFEAFNEKYPEFKSSRMKNISADIKIDNSEESLSIYDLTQAKQSLLSKLQSLNVTDIQKIIIDNIISKKGVTMKYNKKMYPCTEEEFECELEDLKEKIEIIGDI